MADAIVVTGGSSGLGRSIIMHLAEWQVYNLSITKPNNDLAQEDFIPTDVRIPESIEHAARVINSRGDRVRHLINCAGVNYIAPFEEIPLHKWDELIDTNARAIVLTAQTFLRDLAGPEEEGRFGTVHTPGSIINIISDASHKPMTHSAAYNASKGAAHILTLQMARELTKRFGITVLGISPGKMSGTSMTDYIDYRVPQLRGWTREEADAYQRAGRLVPEEIPPEVIAEYIGWLLTSPSRTYWLSGCVIPYGA